jgi:hypothetical protein
MIAYVKNLHKRFYQIIAFSKVAGYKINIKKSVAVSTSTMNLLRKKL